MPGWPATRWHASGGKDCEAARRFAARRKGAMSIIHHATFGRLLRSILRAATVAFVILVAGSAASAAAPAARPMNFVVILADALGAPELGCYGNTDHATPNVDRLASEGMRFETAWATPLCSPTRVMLMTGQFASRTGWY